jgi:hypothetical protein
MPSLASANFAAALANAHAKPLSANGLLTAPDEMKHPAVKTINLH